MHYLYIIIIITTLFDCCCLSITSEQSRNVCWAVFLFLACWKKCCKSFAVSLTDKVVLSSIRKVLTPSRIIRQYRGLKLSRKVRVYRARETISPRDPYTYANCRLFTVLSVLGITSCPLARPIYIPSSPSFPPKKFVNLRAFFSFDSWREAQPIDSRYW